MPEWPRGINEDIGRITILRETTRAGQMISVAWPDFEDWRDRNLTR